MEILQQETSTKDFTHTKPRTPRLNDILSNHTTTKRLECLSFLPIPYTIASACGLGCEVPIRPRNPHRRCTAKFTNRQNLNRNLRLHLRNDRKTVQNDSTLYQNIQDTHYDFYCTLSSFDQWHHTRQVLPHERPHSDHSMGPHLSPRGKCCSPFRTISGHEENTRAARKTRTHHR
jgi:hypothetical protein